MTTREQITIRLSTEMIDELEAEASDKGVSRSEHIRDTLRDRDKIDDLERERELLLETLQRLDRQEPAPPWFIRWIRWFRSR